MKKYLPGCGNDKYAAAADAITDILLSTAETEEEATQILQSAELDFRTEAEGEQFLAEG
ncbi:MAG: hypothetical protein JOZ62_09690 [Acidobacteriaceae bacterium]|nr:hypothetical protein [Acidobacteriaceae bacterium]